MKKLKLYDLLKSNTDIQNSGKSEMSNRVVTIPNFLSFIRIILITPFVNCFLDGDYITAAVMIILSGLSDCVDGFIARVFNQESELGKILDPLADKLTLVAVGVCLIIIQPYVLPVMIILVIKDVMMLIGGSIIIKKGVIVPKSKWYGKLGTILFYITVTIIVSVKVINTSGNPDYIVSRENFDIISICMLAVTLAVMLFALVKYTIMFVDIMKKTKSSGVVSQDNSASITNYKDYK